MPQPLLTGPTKGRRGPACCLSVSEIMTYNATRYSDNKI